MTRVIESPNSHQLITSLKGLRQNATDNSDMILQSNI